MWIAFYIWNFWGAETSGGESQVEYLWWGKGVISIPRMTLVFVLAGLLSLGSCDSLAVTDNWNNCKWERENQTPSQRLNSCVLIICKECVSKSDSFYNWHLLAFPLLPGPWSQEIIWLLIIGYHLNHSGSPPISDRNNSTIFQQPPEQVLLQELIFLVKSTIYLGCFSIFRILYLKDSDVWVR